MSNRSKQTCIKCNSVIKQNFISRNGVQFHLECAKCEIGGEDISKSDFYLNKFFCVNHFQGLKTSKCEICSQLIVGKRVKDLDKYYHEECLVCVECKQPLPDNYYRSPFPTNNGNKYDLYCPDHYNQKFGCVCSLCNKVIEGKAISVDEKHMILHIDCCKCQKCDTIITPENKFFLLNDQPVCGPCIQ